MSALIVNDAAFGLTSSRSNASTSAEGINRAAHPPPDPMSATTGREPDGHSRAKSAAALATDRRRPLHRRRIPPSGSSSPVGRIHPSCRRSAWYCAANASAADRRSLGSRSSPPLAARIDRPQPKHCADPGSGDAPQLGHANSCQRRVFSEGTRVPSRNAPGHMGLHPKRSPVR